MEPFSFFEAVFFLLGCRCSTSEYVGLDVDDFVSFGASGIRTISGFDGGDRRVGVLPFIISVFLTTAAAFLLEQPENVAAWPWPQLAHLGSARELHS